MSDDSVPWDGGRNLADLGGLLLLDGRHTRFGTVWCSAATEWLTNDGWHSARAAGLTRVVDLRNAVERHRGPEHPVIDEDASVGIDVVHAPTEDPEDPHFLAECGPWLDHPRSWKPNMAYYPEKLARVFNAIAEAGGPVLIHCAGGRDRTGMVCSILLGLAGVTPDAIAENYERGFRGAAAHRGHGMAYDASTGAWVHEQPNREWSAEDLDEAVAHRLPVLMRWIETTDFAGYLLDAGLDHRRLDCLRELLQPEGITVGSDLRKQLP